MARRAPAAVVVAELVAIALLVGMCSIGSQMHVLDDKQGVAFASPNDHWSGEAAASVGGLVAIVEDGAAMGDGRAYALASNPADYCASVSESLQLGVMDGGCEIVSLSIALSSMGFDVTPAEIADSYLDMDGSFSSGYAGSPYERGGGFPPGIARAANSFLADKGSSLEAHDLTGTSFEGIEQLLATGRPVLVWSTMDMEEPSFDGSSEDGAAWYSNEHCVVVYGVDGDRVLVSDPLDGLVERNRDDFARIYETCGSMALAIY